MGILSMSMQGAESKHDFMLRFLKVKERSPQFAQFLFLFCGLALTLSAFFILKSFVHGLVEEENAKVSQDFVEEVVHDFYEFTLPLAKISELIVLSGSQNSEDIKRILERKRNDYRYYSQIIWFHKTTEGRWTFSNLLEKNILQINTVQPDGVFLKAALDSGVMNTSDIRLAPELHSFQVQKHRNSPKISSQPFVMTKVVSPGEEGRGFLVAVADAAQIFSEEWITGHRMLSFMKVHDVNGNIQIFEFERQIEGQAALEGIRQAYEFPFAGRNFEVLGVFVQDQRSRFLNVFPYIVGVFGLFLVGVGALYLRRNQQQADVLSKMNEALEQKNYELKVEAEERDRLNQTIRDTEKKSRDIVNAVGDIIFEADENGRIVFLNKAWKDITNFDVAQTIGQSFVQLIHPDNHEQLLSDFSSLVSGKKQSVRHFTQVRVADGTFKAVEVAMNSAADAGVIGTFTDIEERRKVERALSNAERKYRSIVENAAGGIFQLTPEGLYLSANPAFARILGYDNPELLLREVKNANEQLYVDRARRQAFYKELSATRETLSQDVQMHRRDGELIWVQESARAVQDENGQLLFIEGSVEDITQRRESEVAIQQAKVHSDLANRAKSEFLSNMSHELRTPLNSIIGFSEMIRNEVYGKIEQRSYWEYARDIHESGQKLLRVINEILDISKIEAGERQLNEGVVNIASLVDSAVDLLETKIANAQMVITKALDDVPDVIGEELALKQVVLNLLSNAVKFTPDQGRITISGHVGRDGSLHFSVTDTGIGLDEYEVEKALSPFGQVDNEFGRSGSGTGLGLTLVDALVKLHGGEFELFSQKGIGTTATMILPADRIAKSGRVTASKMIGHDKDEEITE